MEVARGEQGQQEDQGFTGLFAYPGGKSKHFGAATSPELIPGHWIWALTYTREDKDMGTIMGITALAFLGKLVCGHLRVKKRHQTKILMAQNPIRCKNVSCIFKPSGF